MDFELPHIGEGVKEAEMLRWLVNPGEVVKPGQPLLELLTDKASMEVPSPFTGTIGQLHVEPGTIVRIGQLVLTYSTLDQAEPQPVRETATTTRSLAASVSKPSNGPTLASVPLSIKAAPSVRMMARKLGVDLTRVSGSGPDGRILVDDLSRFVIPPAASEKIVATKAEPKLDFGQPGTRMKLLGLRRKIAERMVQSKTTIPHYSYIDECNVTALVQLRDSLKEVYAKAGIKLTYLPFFVKAVVQALKRIPMVNASLDESAGEIVLHDRYNIGVAVATNNGLVVPVIHDADKKDLGAIAREIERLSSDARNNRSKLEDLKGGTFTVTSVGSIGGLITTPVINPPEVGIMGIGKVIRRPIYNEDGDIEPADLVYLSWSFDHRVLDGAIGAAFGNAVIEGVINPARLLLPDVL
jgi:pyruvate dehydrogenase E2 component (dihydrolipoamide acetyltransferase)/2-oxoisovalerate dehydrogenase E2 component (dihydrolipoyl transacylase)